MKTALNGRILFSLSAILFGAIALVWHDADTWQNLHELWRLPFGTLIGEILMAAQIGGGLALLYPPTTRIASIVLGLVYGLFALACIPAIAAAPGMFAQYDSFFEQFCLFCGALAAYAISVANVAPFAVLERVARIGLGVCMISFTVAQVVYLRVTAELVPMWIPPNQMFWAILTTVAFALAAIAIVIDVQARIALRLLTLMLGLFGILVWIPLVVTHPQVHGNWSEMALTFLITGATWIVAGASERSSMTTED